jgi:Na+/H+ antiporter NhaC
MKEVIPPKRAFPLRRSLLTLVLVVGLGILGMVVPAGSHGARIAGGPFSLLPPFLAIAIAVVWRRILLALFLGILGGALMLTGGEPVTALTLTARDFVGATAFDLDNITLFAFTLSLMGMVGILIRSGGIEGLVRAIAGFARGRRSTQAIVGLMGTAVFFDDYANAVVVGSSARAITDRARISREKLAYLVDSTAAPVASLAIISTWIGIEVGLLDAQMEYLGELASSGYGVFMRLIPLRFYCLFTLVTVFGIALSGRDFGPMLTAERRAARGQLMRPHARLLTSQAFSRLTMKEGVCPRPVNGWLPIVLVLLFILASFFVAGSMALEQKGVSVSVLSLGGWRDAFGAVTGTGVLLTVAGVLGSLAAFGLAVGQRLLSVREAAGAWFAGARSMLGAIALLILAMTLRKVTDGDHLQLADYVLTVLSGANLVWIPLTVFLVAAVIAFSTGTSYGTMGILIPVAVPLAARSGDPLILLLATGAVLDGAVFGDHCSPISDTTVLSSIGSSCDHLDHVKTQAPYAVLAMVVAAAFGYLLLPMTGTTLTVVYAGGTVALIGAIYAFGRRTEHSGGS